MIEVVQLTQGIRRVPRRAALLGYLLSTTIVSTPALIGLYRCLQFPYLRYPPTVYPRRRRPFLLLAAAGTVNPVTVPNVVGLTLNAALTLFGGTNVQASPITYQNDPSAAGTVLAQSIAAGTSVVANESIGIVVSLGPLPSIGFRVQAVTAGLYKELYYDPGDVFDLLSSADFSDSSVNYEAGGGESDTGWMVQVPQSTPLYRARDISVSLPVSDPNRRFVL